MEPTHHIDQWFSTTFVFTLTPLRGFHTEKTKCYVENHHFHNETIKFIAIGASNIKACFKDVPGGQEFDVHITDLT